MGDPRRRRPPPARTYEKAAARAAKAIYASRARLAGRGRMLAARLAAGRWVTTGKPSWPWGRPPGLRWTEVVAVSQFSQVDSAPDVDALVAYLDGTDRALSPMKSYIVATASLHAPSGVVLDVGCGVGGDLARLGSAGLCAVGLDASTSMLATARRRLGREVPLTQGDAARLPLRASSVDGCRIERVLQHVVSPAAVIEEIARVVRPGGFLAAFDTDYGTYSAEQERRTSTGRFQATWEKVLVTALRT